MDYRRCAWLGLVLLSNVIIITVESCDPGFTKGNTSTCIQCPFDTYKDSEGEAFCSKCPGTTATLNIGRTSADQCLSLPKLIQMTPPFGPLAGNTQMTFRVASLQQWNVTDVVVADLPCIDVTVERPDNITCSTSPSNNVVSGHVVLSFTSEEGPYKLNSTTFSYKSNPVVDRVFPNRTITSGGLTLTVLGSSLASVSSPKMEVTVISPKSNVKKYSQVCQIHNSTTMTCITPNLFNALPSTNSSRPINQYGYRVFVGFTLDGVTKFQNISKVVPDFGELEVYSNPQCLEKNYEFEEDEHIVIDGVHFNYVASKEDISVTVGDAPCLVETIRTNAIFCLPPQQPPDGQNKPIIKVTFGAGPVIYTIGHLEYKVEPVWQVPLAVCFCIAVILVALAFVLFWMHKKKQKGQSGLKRQPSRPNEYVVPRSSSVDDGYLTPASSEHPDAGDNRNSLASRSTASGYSEQSARPSLEEMQKRASLASLILSLVQERSASISSITSAPSVSPNSPLSSILENGEALPPTPGAPSVPMSNNMAYFLQPHMVSELDDELPMLAAQGALIDKTRLQLGDTIGKGFFGKVYRGELFDENGGNPDIVAVKTVQGVQISEKDVASFLHEAIIMQAFHHENVLSLLAVVMDEGRPYVVLPFMEHGDLKSYVSHASMQFTVLQLLGLGVQVASGMAYLATQKFVHRDLACRNCMINKELCVKIADFGLSRDVYYSQYYRVETKHRPLPVKWMAIESLAEGVFSTKTDVWSFGVLLWELLTRGCPPYADVNSYHIKAYLKSGRRLDKPAHATDEIYDIMLSCWKEAPEDRPTFDVLQRRLTEMSEKKTVPDYLELIP